MKLAQRTVLGYYRYTFRALARLSPRLAARAAFRLFCTPTIRLNRHAPAVFSKAQHLRFSFEGIAISGFQWKAAGAAAPTILICHGFNSGSYRFDQYVQYFLDQGMNVLAFDAPAHGTSGGKRLNVLLYRNLLLHVQAQYGPVQGIMAHSLGGLAAALAAEAMQDAALRLVLIAPATETTTAMQQFFNLMALPAAVRTHFEQVLAEVGGHPASWFSVNRAVQQFNGPVLWLHDELDNLCPYADTTPTRDAQLSHIQFITTKGLGHSGIYRDPIMAARIVTFLTGNR